MFVSTGPWNFDDDTPNGRGEPNLLVRRLFVDHIRPVLAQIEGDNPTLWRDGQQTKSQALSRKSARYIQLPKSDHHGNLIYSAARRAAPPWLYRQVSRTKIAGVNCITNVHQNVVDP